MPFQKPQPLTDSSKVGACAELISSIWCLYGRMHTEVCHFTPVATTLCICSVHLFQYRALCIVDYRVAAMLPPTPRDLTEHASFSCWRSSIWRPFSIATKTASFYDVAPWCIIMCGASGVGVPGVMIGLITNGGNDADWG